MINSVMRVYFAVHGNNTFGYELIFPWQLNSDLVIMALMLVKIIMNVMQPEVKPVYILSVREKTCDCNHMYRTGPGLCFHQFP